MSDRPVRSFRKILIANRGEIAIRIARTCREMGITSVAVYSEADRLSAHVKAADEAFLIGASAPGESYLSIERVLAAASAARAEAIHPGYGFLSENPSFAAACAEAGMEFIGPSAETIGAMGDKIVARASARKAGLPVLPAYEGEAQTPSALRHAIVQLGLPAMIKAAAGGGGRGMRVVRHEAEIDSAIASASREATRAFGDGRLFVERLVEGARHVEVQIVGDVYGNVVHLFERDCSLQRRHQKLIEETPAPNLSVGLRSRLHEMAVALGRSIGYCNAGTVEFLVTADESPYFIEVNSRLQVEHPVTEMVTGLDLVRLQIEVAQGHRLSFSQEEVVLRGHAIEARLYAEDARHDFLPTSGVIRSLELPTGVEDVRVDSGVSKGTVVSTHYDGLLAKLASHAPSRDDALRKLAHAMSHTVVQGLTTNRAFIIRLLEHEPVVSGTLSTSYIEEHVDLLTEPSTRPDVERAAMAVAVFLSHSWRAAEPNLSGLPLSYRNNPWRLPSIELRLDEETLVVSWREQDHGCLEVAVCDVKARVRPLSFANDDLSLEIDGVQRRFRIVRDEERIWVSQGKVDSVFERLPRYPLQNTMADAGVANAPMPGQVLKILVEKGQHVVSGQALIVLEAMKMEQTIRAAVSGVVDAVLVEPGAVVSPGELLVRIISEERSAESVS